MTGTTQAKDVLFASVATDDAWLEVGAVGRSRPASQPPPLATELTNPDRTRALDGFDPKSPQTASTAALSASTAASSEGEVWMLSIAELRELLLPGIGNGRDDDGERPSCMASAALSADPADRVAAKAAHARLIPLHLILLVVILGAAAVVGGVGLVVVAKQNAQPASSPAPATGQLWESDVHRAQISTGGDQRRATLREVALDPGAHAVQFTSRGSKETIAVSIGPQSTGVYEVQLTSPDRVAVATLRVSAATTTEGVTLAHEHRGLTPTTSAQADPRFHDVAVGQSRVAERHDVSVEQDRAMRTSVPFAASPSVRSEASFGWVVVASPIPVELFEHGELVGSSRVARIMMSSGSHVLDFVNTELGYRTRRAVDVVASETTRVPLEVPQGVLSVNATPWAELWVDGMRIGDTPLGRVPLPIGQHDLVLKHPQLGERRLQVLVRSDIPARASVDMWQ